MICELCKKEKLKKDMKHVYEPNICEDVYLCQDCLEEFSKCTECSGYFLNSEIKDGKCTSCI